MAVRYTSVLSGVGQCVYAESDHNDQCRCGPVVKCRLLRMTCRFAREFHGVPGFKLCREERVDPYLWQLIISTGIQLASR